ncbi:PqqD family peptide modification chaperone [Dysgonomonas termitidis]|uniref:PqqD family peptide modification chaperone n=1 Tax=Dysgonomonas termitidis TaxID=1516126 RepID=A0ABV9KRK6_9BACT
MRTKKGLRLRTIGREYIVSGEGLEQVDFNKLIALNKSAAYLWQEVEGYDFEVQTLTGLLIAKYDISDEQALADAADVADSWIKAGIAEE